MKIFTPNMLNTYCDCSKKYYFNYVKNIRVPQPENSFVVGKNIHALASYYLKGEDISKYDLPDKESFLWQNLRKINYLDMHAVKIEQNILSKVNDNWIGGRVDAVVKDDHNNYYILDYKTGSVPKDYIYAAQTMVYMLCCDSLFEGANSLNFVYINARTSEVNDVMLTSELKQEYIKRIDEIIGKIHRDAFINKIITDKCNMCLYKKICP